MAGMNLIRRSVPLLLAPAALCWAALTGLGEGTHPLADSSDSFGVSLEFLGDAAAAGWCLALAAALITGGLVVARPVGASLPARDRAIVVGSAVLALLTLDHTLLMLLGYLPLVLVRMTAGRTDGLSDLASAGLGLQLLVATAAAVLLLALRRRAQPGQGGPATAADQVALASARTRRWTLIAIEAPVVYAVTRLLMFVEAPGFGGFDEETRAAGLGLALAAIAGAVLTLGLIRPWGERFPRWAIGLAGRRVPPDLAVLPALVVAGLILAASRAIAVGAVAAGSDAWRVVAEAPLVSLPHLLWPVWGCALALAALGYQRRRAATDVLAGRVRRG